MRWKRAVAAYLRRTSCEAVSSNSIDLLLVLSSIFVYVRLNPLCDQFYPSINWSEHGVCVCRRTDTFDGDHVLHYTHTHVRCNRYIYCQPHILHITREHWRMTNGRCAWEKNRTNWCVVVGYALIKLAKVGRIANDGDHIIRPLNHCVCLCVCVWISLLLEATTLSRVYCITYSVCYTLDLSSFVSTISNSSHCTQTR